MSNKYKLITAGAVFSIAVSMSGGVWAWGSGANGQLGISNLTQASTPMKVGKGEEFGTQRVIDIQAGET